MPTAPGLRWSSVQVLTRPDPAYLPRLDIGVVQGGMAIDHGPWLHWDANPGPSACKAGVLAAAVWNHTLTYFFYLRHYSSHILFLILILNIFISFTIYITFEHIEYTIYNCFDELLC